MNFVVVIGNEGRIGREILISGYPWFAQGAVAALHEWVYEPTLVDQKSVADRNNPRCCRAVGVQ